MRVLKLLRTAITLFLFFTVVCGVLYTGVVTGIAQLVFPSQANGSVIQTTNASNEEVAVGSKWIAQTFTDPAYMIGRPDWDRNLSPTSEVLKTLVQERVEWFEELDPDNPEPIPNDLLSASGSGVDPNISPEAAAYQVNRIAKERNLSKEVVQAVIKQQTTGRSLGIWGEPTVNVLGVNLALDETVAK
ncbi:potassium-transporting ATPase subunit C [Marinilactibacillus sp. XAAS-LB27]|uniref:potassium-transporting ATPase subunit C n=1 Tax=Marinilactibacillus sp. XAAS-LB27 TaxID=3114538 RepID=UPI002E181D33|nr:potassium-transporting ATPase subunit C [Marinilactibacillus sp. XAAS-LB27]